MGFYRNLVKKKMTSGWLSHNSSTFLGVGKTHRSILDSLGNHHVIELKTYRL